MESDVPKLCSKIRKLMTSIQKRDFYTYKVCYLRLNMVPVALEKFPTTFGLQDVESKPFFPYLYNTTTNLFGQPLPHLPPKSDYFYDSMKLEKRQKFNEWYEVNKNQPFDLQEQLPSYCMSDVRILAHGLEAFRRLWMQHCVFDILQRCSTLASGVMTFFRMRHLWKGTVGVASELSYEKHDRQSSIGLKYLKWLQEQWNLGFHKIQHADEGGEYQHYYRLYPDSTHPIASVWCDFLFFDGFLKGGRSGNEKDLVIEING